MSHNTSLKAMRNRTSYKTVVNGSGQDGPVTRRIIARFHCLILFKRKSASCSWWAAAMQTLSLSRLAEPGIADRAGWRPGDRSSARRQAGQCGHTVLSLGCHRGRAEALAPAEERYTRDMWPSWGTCSPVGCETLRRAAALLAATAPVNSVACSVAVASGHPSR